MKLNERAAILKAQIMNELTSRGLPVRWWEDSDGNKLWYFLPIQTTDGVMLPSIRLKDDFTITIDPDQTFKQHKSGAYDWPRMAKYLEAAIAEANARERKEQEIKAAKTHNAEIIKRIEQDFSHSYRLAYLSGRYNQPGELEVEIRHGRVYCNEAQARKLLKVLQEIERERGE